MEGVIDDFFAFMIAGMETTAITMSILIWLLLKNPDVFQKVITEVKFPKPVLLYLFTGFCMYVYTLRTSFYCLSQ